MGFITGTIIGSFFIVALSTIGIYYALKKNSLKRLIKKLGKTAEDQINADLKTWAKHTDNKFIGAGVYKYDEIKVFEIDSILITKEALFVIEIKSINGGIQGDGEEDVWLKVQGDNKFNISNPVKQNEKHIKHIINMTGIKIPTISLIIYSNKAKFINVKNIPGHVLIIKHADLFEELDKLTVNLPPRLSHDDIKQMIDKIKSSKADKEGINLHKKITTGKRSK